MNQRLTRRRFAQIAIASTVATGLGYANKTSAQTPLTLYGARPDAQAGVVFLQALNLVTDAVEEMTTAKLDIGEKLIDFTSLVDGTLILAIGPVRSGKKENAPTRLVFLGTSPKTLTISGLKKQEGLESLLGTNDGSLIGLVNKKDNKSSVKLVNINITNGEINLSNKIKLSATKRFSNLVQWSNGTIYTIAVGQEGEVTLVSLDLGQGKASPISQLKFNDQVWDNGLSDLVSSSTDQFFALGASRYESTNNLYSLDTTTGTMTLLREFDVTKITPLRV